MNKGNQYFNRLTHERLTFEGPFDEERAIVTNRNGRTFITHNENLYPDYETNIVRQIITTLKQLWNQTPPNSSSSH